MRSLRRRGAPDRIDERRVVVASSGLGDAPDDARAIAFLALLSGGVTLSRAVRDPALAERIADAVGQYAVAIAERAKAQPEKRE
ncbi:hypothetical protein [Burkholderia ubonensis]|uniref:TetR family transcriptional regulator n=1 Tax=Burkholderia ubonensis TaxID=101571 RepID=A0A108JUM9_9BURK|nr:hypothetical protein [Burkholderia ubonensis]KVS40120.1 hypothetical protein WK37_23945 [Burkholderia ubonensis]KVS48489.1 hypothetical protein WK38_19590 [Burkholderia ubonensis]KVS81904.1 hypothetical protein WK42_11165 [Burkholderia ubonensis]KVS86118.1 hypothetical protein WK44_20965 [Burkholderia ubonensis]KVS88746.1 hypothetical protein WK43_17530 [Burkholderia ubonensis]